MTERHGSDQILCGPWVLLSHENEQAFGEFATIEEEDRQRLRQLARTVLLEMDGIQHMTEAGRQRLADISIQPKPEELQRLMTLQVLGAFIVNGGRILSGKEHMISRALYMGLHGKPSLQSVIADQIKRINGTIAVPQHHSKTPYITRKGLAVFVREARVDDLPGVRLAFHRYRLGGRQEWSPSGQLFARLFEHSEVVVDEVKGKSRREVDPEFLVALGSEQDVKKAGFKDVPTVVRSLRRMNNNKIIRDARKSQNKLFITSLGEEYYREAQAAYSISPRAGAADAYA